MHNVVVKKIAFDWIERQRFVFHQVINGFVQAHIGQRARLRWRATKASAIQQMNRGVIVEGFSGRGLRAPSNIQSPL